MEVVAVALALTAGFLVGLNVGVRRALAAVAKRRAIAGTNAQLSRLWPAELPSRSAADIIAGLVRVSLGGMEYELPVLPRASSRQWINSLNDRFAALAAELDQAGNDTPQILTRLVAESDGLYDMLLSYDASHVLPPREEIDELATDAEILRSVIEVWRAVNPLADILAEQTRTDDEPPTSTSPVPSSSPPRPTGGVSAISSRA